MRKFITVFSFLVLSSCTSSSHQYDQEVDTVDLYPSLSHISYTKDCKPLTLDSSSVWHTAEGTRVQFYSRDGNSFLSYEDSEALVNDSEIFWVWSDLYEGYSQSLNVECSCDNCILSFSTKYIGLSGDLVVYPSSDSFSEIDKVLSLISFPDSVSHNWSSDTLSLDLSSPKNILTLSDGGFTSFDAVSYLGDSEYLIHRSYSSGFKSDVFIDNGDWFSTVKLIYNSNPSECLEGEGMGLYSLDFSISDYWSHYRTDAVNNRHYSDHYNLNYIDHSMCLIATLEADIYYNGLWYSDSGEWMFDFESGIVSTPYDTRELKYISTVSVSDTDQFSVFTYGKPHDRSYDLYDSLYTHVIYFSKDDSGCVELLHDLDTDSEFGFYNEYPSTYEKLCRSVDDSVVYKSYYGDIIELSSDFIEVHDSSKLVISGSIISESTHDNGNTWYSDMVVLVQNSERLYSDCINSRVAVRVFHYPNGTNYDSRHYVYFMYPKNVECTDSVSSFNKKIGPYYLD